MSLVPSPTNAFYSQCPLELQRGTTVIFYSFCFLKAFYSKTQEGSWDDAEDNLSYKPAVLKIHFSFLGQFSNQSYVTLLTLHWLTLQFLMYLYGAIPSDLKADTLEIPEPRSPWLSHRRPKTAAGGGLQRPGLLQTSGTPAQSQSLHPPTTPKDFPRWAPFLQVLDSIEDPLEIPCDKTDDKRPEMSDTNPTKGDQAPKAEPCYCLPYPQPLPRKRSYSSLHP